MRESRVMTDGLRSAIERSGYYPGLVSGQRKSFTSFSKEFQFASVKPSVLIVAISFFFYVVSRLAGPTVVARRSRRTVVSASPPGAPPDLAEFGL